MIAINDYSCFPSIESASHCGNNHCSHLCLPIGHHSQDGGTDDDEMLYTCACPDGTNFRENSDKICDAGMYCRRVTHFYTRRARLLRFTL